MATPTRLACARSIFQWHNETGNIWSHLLSFFGAVWVHHHAATSEHVLRHPRSTTEIHLAFHAFFFAAEICFLASTAYHTFQSHSYWTFQKVYQLDLLGINTLIVASFLPGLCLGFQCQPNAKAFYVALILVVYALGLRLVALEGSVQADERLARDRKIFFVAAVTFGICPAFHFALSHGLHSEEVLLLGYLAAMFLLYGLGFAVFSLKLPERFMPGLFDLFGASHFWWHLFVSCAAYVWYKGILELHSLRCKTTCL